jgi:hypothetical protein
MNNQNKSDLIELPPRIPEVQADGVSHWMDWQADMPRPITPAEAKELETFLSKNGISVCFFVGEGNHINIRIKQTPVVDYTQLYDASLRALFYLEKQIGNLVTIEGYPRSKWDIQFVFAKRFGALE